MSNTYTNSITLARLSDGVNGQPGTGITGRTVQYYVNQDDSINPATIPSSSWGGNFPTITQGDCLWTKTTINYTSGEPSIIYSVSRIGEDGTPGTPGTPGAPGAPGDTISTVQYGTSNDANTNPTNWNTTTPTNLTKGTWLWVKTTYSNNTEATTKSYIGTDGTSVYIQSATKVGDVTTVVIADSEGHTNTLTIQDGTDGTNGTNGTNGLNGYVHTAWANSSNGQTDFSTSVSAGKLYLGVYTDNVQADSQTPSDYFWTLIKGADGINGTNGINNATIYLYQRAISAPTCPNNDLTYTFATKTISGSALGNWQQTIPTGTNPVWLTIATANSSDSTDTIGSSEWTTPIRLDGQEGAPGVGIDGYNQATLYLYKRAATAPEAPSATVTYTFSNGSFTAPTGWDKQIPSGSNPCYVTTAAAISRDSTAQVSNWSTPAKLVEDGASITITDTTYEYVLSTSGTNPPSSGWEPTPVAPTTTQYSWTKTTTTYSDGSTTITYTVGGKSGTNGNRGTTWYSGTNITGTSTTPAIFNGSGVSSAIVGDHYLNTSTQNVYVCTTAGAASTAKWKYEQNIKGTTGAQFTGITNHYLVTSYSSGVSKTDSPSTYGSWTTTLNEEISSSKPYLWAYEDIKIDGAVASSTDPRIIGRYGTDGQNGTPGTPGRGITGVAEWYQISNNNFTPPYTPTADGTNYSNSPIPPTKANPYLWNYEVITYTTGNPDITTPKVVSNYSESNYFHVKYSNDGGQTFTANDGETLGAYIGTYVDTTEADSTSVGSYNWSKIEGVQIASVEYKAGNSSTQEPSGNWLPTLPSVSGGQYLWTKTTYTDGNIQYSVAKQGVSVTGTIGYYLATSASSGVTASQVTATTMQQMTSTNKYLWYCEANTFDDGTTGSKSNPVIIGVYGETGRDGDAIQYEPGFSNAKILKFYDEDGSTVYNVSSIQFWLNKIENGTATRMTLSQYKVELGFYSSYNGTAVVSENFFTSLSNVSGQYEDGAGNTVTSTNLQAVARTTNTTTNLINLNFENLFKYNSTNTNFVNISNAFKYSSGFFYVRFYSSAASGTYPTGSDYLIAQTVINFDFGTSSDMARFGITANKIQAAVDQSALTFSAEGLKITNGGFKIVRTEDNTEIPILEYSEAQGQLNIVGGGTFSGVIEATDGIFRGEVYANSGNFTGTVNATDGSFNGEITAQSGSIGGFEILEGQLISTNSTVDDNPNDEITPNPTLIINGTTGEITGGSIHLTSKAVIDDYIAVGAAAIFNPSLYDHTFISTENNTIIIKDTGLMTLGNITLNGINSTIVGSNFSITPQNSIFNNIVATGKIVTSVFETNKVQSVGGTMLFKPSYKVKEIESDGGIILDTEETLNINLGDKLLLIDKEGSALPNYFTVLSVQGTLKKITVDEPLTINELNSIVVLGQENALIMGVNSGESTSLLKARGFTISEFVERDNEFTTDLKVFLGDLSSLSTIGLNGYGLYSDNVFLNGSLTTVFSSGSTSKYAGVNTLSQASATIINNDNSRIIFWAGSNDTSQESIQNAPFQVTSNGSIYASQGIFTGSVISDTIISNSEIYGSTIYGAKIVGWNNGQAGGLELWNTNNGISFMRDEYTQVSINSFASGVQYYTIENGVYTLATTYDSEKTYYTRAEETTLQVVQDGILFPILTSTDNKYVIRINNNQVYLKGNALETPYISILNGKLQSTLDSSYWISIHSPTTDMITLNTNGNKATFSQGEVIFEQLSFSCAGNVTYGENFSYKRVISDNVTIGYDLYIGG